MDILVADKSRLVKKRFLNKVSKKCSYWKNSVTFDRSFCIAHSICLNMLKGAIVHFYCLFDESLFSNISTL